jgi:hypothetical protein
MTSTRRRSLSHSRVAEDRADIIPLDSRPSSTGAIHSGGSSIPLMEQHDGVCQPEQLHYQYDSTGDAPYPHTVTPMEQEATDRTISPDTMEATPVERSRRSDMPRQRTLWSPGNRNILLLCMLVIIPITAFTATMLRLVFGNKTDAGQCAYQELCPNNGSISGIDTEHNYYVDYPAARLAFVASWSSTVSQHTNAALLF